jgi:PAS domain S-box-containing protein
MKCSHIRKQKFHLLRSIRDALWVSQSPPNRIVFLLALSEVSLWPLLGLVRYVSRESVSSATHVALGLLIVHGAVSVVLIARKKSAFPRVTIPILWGVLFTFVAAFGKGINGQIILAFPLVILLSALLLKPRSVFIAAGLLCGALLFLVRMQQIGFIETTLNAEVTFVDFLVLSAILFSVALLVYVILALSNFRLKNVMKTEITQQRNVLDAVIDAVVEIDSDGKVTAWNVSAEKTFGWKKEEALGAGLESLIIPTVHHAAHSAGMKHYLTTGEGPILNTRVELVALRKDRSELPIELQVTSSVRSHAQFFTAFIRDLTEIKRAAETQEQLLDEQRASEQRYAARMEAQVVERTAQLRESNSQLEISIRTAELLAKKADHANQAKSVFLANMSHEIRTPMNAVLGFTQLLLRETSLTGSQRGHLETIERAGGHLLHLINDVLDMSKIESGRIVIKSTDFSLDYLLADLESLFRSRSEEKGVHLLVEGGASVPSYVRGDEAKMRQVLVNLLGNAVKVTDVGSITLRVQWEDGGEDSKDWLVFEVDDTGPGISEKNWESIFAAFEQTVEGRDAGGTGLGLAISRNMARLLGGDLRVTSEVGKGSCFRFAVPVEWAEAVETKRLETRRVIGLQSPQDEVRILVVDDNQDNRALLRGLLAPVGFAIREAANGKEALAQFEAWHPHAILMDIRMPEMDGYEATRRLKATRAGRSTPVVAVTASVMDGAQGEVHRAGADAYIRKPFQHDEVFETLRRVLDVTYEYAGEEGKESGTTVLLVMQKQMATWPKEMVTAMRQALEEGDMSRMRDAIEPLKEVDPASAAALQALTEQYDYETLGRLFG